MFCFFCPDAEQSETVTSVNTCNLFVLVFVQSCMRSSCPEPRRSGGVTVKPARSTTARAVRHGAGPTSYIAQRSGPNSNNMLNSFLFVCFLVEGASLADRESSLDLIKLDISRTFPSLFIFQKVTDSNSRSSFHVFIFLLCLMNLPFTPPHLFSLQGGPYHDLLHSVLGAYTCYRPDIGYVSLLFSSTMKRKPENKSCLDTHREN